MRHAVLLLAAIAAVLAPPAPAFADGDDGPERTPLPLAEARTRLRRAEGNLRLHGLTLSPVHLDRALEDYRAVVGGMPEDADADMRFDAPFAMAFAMARAEFPADPGERRQVLNGILDALAAAATVNPEFPGLFLVEGLAREKNGDYPAAADLITRGLRGLEGIERLAPWQVYQLRLFGLVARGEAFQEPALGRQDLAEKDFTEALALADEALRSPDAPRGSRLRVELLTHLADSLLRLDYFPRCEKVLRSLVELDPGNATHAYNLAVVHARQQKFPEAKALYRRAAELNSRFALPRLKLAYILLKYPAGGAAPDVAGALEQIEAYRALVGGRTDEYCACRGEAALLQEDRAEAEKWFREALERNPRCRQALDSLVKILGRDPDPGPERKKELGDLVRRLNELLRGDPGKETPEPRPADTTFCRATGGGAARRRVRPGNPRIDPTHFHTITNGQSSPA